LADITELAKSILAEYNEISSISTGKKNDVYFQLNGSEYAFFFFEKNAFPTVCIVENYKNYPHFSPKRATIDGKNYQTLCLFEEGALIEYIHTAEERIRVCVDRLIELSSLSYNEVVSEYQKEFLFYWANASTHDSSYTKMKYQIYLDDANHFCWLEQQYYPRDVIRIAKPGKFFNDSKDCSRVSEIPVLFLPLISRKDIIPPLPGEPWDSKQINRLVNGLEHQYISTEAYREISAFSYSKKEIMLVFKLNNIVFSCVIVFRNAGTAKLSIKFESQIQDVIPVISNRCDYTFLNEQIGNTISDKRITVVGAGSLGSYIISELIYAGFRKITIIDDDSFQYENTFRHKNRYFSNGIPKVDLLKIELQHIHPEIEITAIKEALSEDNVERLQVLSSDIIVFTVGNSDVQLKLNKALYDRNIKIPIYHAWLESDGRTSHVVAIRDYHQGCFECLFTDKNGNLVNNTLNITNGQTKIIIRNGCGGTRVPYGNMTLLTATATLITALKDSSDKNFVYSFRDNRILKNDFPKNTRCKCCGIQE